MSNFIDKQYTQVAQAEVSKKRSENVKALEEKQKQLELESFRRSEAIEAARREQLRKQRHNEQLLREAAEAAEHEEQEKIEAERVEREKKRLREIETQKKRIEQAKADERARQIAREKQLQEQKEAAAAAKAEEERRRQQYLEETAGERMKKSYDRLMEKLGSTISADKQMMEEDTAKRRRERQLASDAATALSRVKAIEHTLQKHREHDRVKVHQKIEKEEHENLDDRFHISVANQDPQHSYLTLTSPQRKKMILAASEHSTVNNVDLFKSTGENEDIDDTAAHAAEFDDDKELEGGIKVGNGYLFHDPDEAMSPEKLRSILLVGNGPGGSYMNSAFATVEEEKRREEEQQQQGQNGSSSNNNKNSAQDSENDEKRGGKTSDDANNNNSNNTTSYYGSSVTSKSNRRKRELKPLDFETWQKQREAEAELVSLSLEYQMRTGQ